MPTRGMPGWSWLRVKLEPLMDVGAVGGHPLARLLLAAGMVHGEMA